MESIPGLNVNLLGAVFNVVAAFIGGAIVPFLPFVRGSTLPEGGWRGLFLKGLMYAVPGTLLAIVYQMSKIDLSPVLALNLGVTGPAVFTALQHHTPPPVSG